MRSSSKLRRTPNPMVSAAGVTDRLQQAAAEPVVRRPADRHQTGLDRLLLGEPPAAEVAEERLAVTRREADAEVGGDGLVEVALDRELPRGQRVRRGQLLGVETWATRLARTS